MGKSDKITSVKISDLKPITPNYSHVRDRRAREYVWKPKAKHPYSRHSIHYPPHAKSEDEDIPIQNKLDAAINGASPELLLAAIYMEMRDNSKTDPTVLYHIERALGRLKSLNQIECVL